MDILLSNERKIASTIRHILGIAGGVGIGFAVASQADVDGILKAFDAVVSNLDGLLGAAAAAAALGTGIYAKIKAKLG